MQQHHHPLHHRLSTNAILVEGPGENRAAALAQQQIQAEIQRFESVHPRIYQVYDLLNKIRTSSGDRKAELVELIREQVISIEDTFVNSQEWTLSRAINEIRVGVIGSEGSCKNSLIHYFLTRNWNWEDAPEGGRFKKEVIIDGRSYLLLIRDEGSREPNAQFANWIDALLIVFAVESRQSFNTALELHQKVQTFSASRPSMDNAGGGSGELPVYLVGMKNMAQMTHQRMVGDEETHRAVKVHKMCNHFECADGSSVLRMFNSVCQRVVQQRSMLRTASSSSFIGHHQYGEFPSSAPADNSSNSAPIRHHSTNNHFHQRSISVLPINSTDPSQLLAGVHSSANFVGPRSRTPRNDLQQQQQHYANNNHFQPPVASSTNFRHLQNYASFTPNSSSYHHQLDRRRESMDPHWPRSSCTASSSSTKQQQHQQQQFAMPTTPSSCSALRHGGGAEQFIGGGISPAYSHSSLSSSHYGIGGGGGGSNNSHNHNNGMTSSHMVAAASPYTRSSSAVMHHAARPDASNHSSYFNNAATNNELLFLEPGLLSTATSSSTLVVGERNNASGGGGGSAGGANGPTPGSTPNTQRKHRRISNIFRKETLHTPEERAAKSSADIGLGIGRAIPLKQGQLYKRSKNGLNKEWKKKYVCLYPDGRICYHQNLKDYMDKDSRGKEIYLGLATVRTSDRHRPKERNGGNANRNSMLVAAPPGGSKEDQHQQLPHDRSNDASLNNDDGTNSLARSPMGELSEGVSDAGNGGGIGGTDSAGACGGLVTSTSSSVLIGEKEGKGGAAKKEKQHKEKKKRTKRTGNEEDEECCEFEVVSCNQKRWEFSASSVEERDKWVACIEHEIEKCLQQQLSLKDMQQQQQYMNGSRAGQSSSSNGGNAAPSASRGVSESSARADIQALRRIAGNDKCADCGTPSPDWASINLGTLICIECSGIHRKLGSHISKVRSLELDDWPPEHLAVMQAIGNELANRIWEHNAPEKEKPGPDAPRERKEQWIRMIYERKPYLPPIPVDRTLGQQLVEAVLGRNIEQLLTVLPRCGKNDVNASVDAKDRRTVVHLACDIGAPEILQLLIWYNADLHALDEQGRNALWHAQVNGAAECACILVQAGLRTAEDNAAPAAEEGGGAGKPPYAAD